MKPRHAFRARAVALLMTLAFLVIITIAVVGVTITLRLERVASDSNLDRFRAETMARDAVSEACAKLRKRTSSPDMNWVSQPGRLVASKGAGDFRLEGDEISYMYSTPDGSAPASSASAGAALNAREFLAKSGGSSYVLSGSESSGPDPMRVAWVYARADGELVFDDPPAYDKANPVIGRFAYWVDDETARININTAAGRAVAGGANPEGTDRGSGSPSNVELGAVGGMTSDLVADIVTAREGGTQAQPFRTFAEAKRVTGAGDILEAGRLDFTPYGYDPDITYFQEPKIVLTTQQSRAGGRPFLDILTVENSDPGTRASLNGSKLSAAVKEVREYLARDDWPMVDGGGSLETKYGSRQLWQIAVNIVNLVRSAESSKAVIEPVRFKISGSTVKNELEDSTINGNDGEFTGVMRGPLITEMGVSYDTEDISTAFGAEYWRIRYYVEVHLPKDYGIAEIDLAQPEQDKRLYVYLASPTGPWGATPAPNYLVPMQFGSIWRNPSNPKGPVGGREFATQAFHRVEPADIISLDAGGSPIRGTETGGTTILKAGGYLTIEKDFWIKVADVKNGTSIDTRSNFKAGNKVFLRAGLSIGSDLGTGSNEGSAALPRVAMAPLMGASGSTRLWLPLGPAGNVLPNLLSGAYSLQCDDPRAGAVLADWSVDTPTFCKPNAVRSVGKAPSSVAPPQDADKSGKVSDASLRFPAPKGSAGNPEGLLASVAELGGLPTGLESQSSTNTESIPWRTLRFQPTPGGARSDVPDWSVLDLFTVPFAIQAPTERLSAYYAPHGTTAGGRVNLNSGMLPFSQQRETPLQAVFLNAPNDATNAGSLLSASSAATIAENIAAFKLASDGVLYGRQDVYESPGEVFEIAGVTDGGEESEEVARQIANLLTCRGGVFAVYSVGQAVSQSSNGAIHVLAEQRTRADIERVQDPETGAVWFRPVLFKALR